MTADPLTGQLSPEIGHHSVATAQTLKAPTTRDILDGPDLGRELAVPTSGSMAKRSPRSTFRRPSPAFAVLRDDAHWRGISRQCQQTSC